MILIWPCRRLRLPSRTLASRGSHSPCGAFYLDVLAVESRFAVELTHLQHHVVVRLRELESLIQSSPPATLPAAPSSPTDGNVGADDFDAFA